MGEGDRHGVDDGHSTGPDPDDNARVSRLEDELAYLRDENRRKDEIIMQQAMTIRQLSGAPTQSAEDAEADEEPPHAAQSHSAAGRVPERTEPPRQRDDRLVPAEDIQWWKYVLGATVLFVLSFCAPYVASALALDEGSIFARPLSGEFVLAAALLGLLWLAPGLFGLWVGFRRRLSGGWTRAVFVGLAIGIVSMLGLWEGTLRQGVALSDPGATLIPWLFLPTTILYISGELIGNAWQRRSAEVDHGGVPVRSASVGAWSPRSQAMLGFAGTIIAALISLIGTVISIAWGN